MLETKHIDFDYQTYICPRCLKQKEIHVTSDCTDCLNNFGEKVMPINVKLIPKTDITVPEDIKKVIEDFEKVNIKDGQTFESFCAVIQAAFLHPFREKEAQDILISFFSGEISEAQKKLNQQLEEQELEEETSYGFESNMRSAILNFSHSIVKKRIEVKNMSDIREQVKKYIDRFYQYYIEDLEQYNYSVK